MTGSGRKKELRFANVLNMLLRLGSLAAKLIFTLYIGRYLGLAEMGAYGLITAYVAVLITLLGVRFDYVASRDIVDETPLGIARIIKDQNVFYGLNYLAIILVAVLALAAVHGAHADIILFVCLLSIMESLASITSGNLVSLKQPILANILFFIRAALWVFPVLALGIASPAFRTVQTILFCWMLGVIASLVLTFIAWRHLPWRQALRTPVDWAWIRAGVMKCFPIWLGVIGITVATYVDRFVVQHYLGLDYVGVASFYGSFVLAIQALLQSGVFAFSYPRLISYHRRDDHPMFRNEAWRMTAQAMLFAGIVSVGIGMAVPILGNLFHRPEFTANAVTLWLMLFGNWLRSATEGLYYVLYARHQDRLVWIGGLLMLIPALGCNLVLVPLLGFQGIGYSCIFTGIFLCVWRLWSVVFVRLEPTEASAPALPAVPIQQSRL